MVRGVLRKLRGGRKDLTALPRYIPMTRFSSKLGKVSTCRRESCSRRPRNLGHPALLSDCPSVVIRTGRLDCPRTTHAALAKPGPMSKKGSPISPPDGVRTLSGHEMDRMEPGRRLSSCPLAHTPVVCLQTQLRKYLDFQVPLPSSWPAAALASQTSVTEARPAPRGSGPHLPMSRTVPSPGTTNKEDDMSKSPRHHRIMDPKGQGSVLGLVGENLTRPSLLGGTRPGHHSWGRTRPGRHSRVTESLVALTLEHGRSCTWDS